MTEGNDKGAEVQTSEATEAVAGAKFIAAGSAVLGWLGMDKVRREVALVSFWQGRWQLGFCVLFLPFGYSLSYTQDSAQPRPPKEGRHG